MSHVHNTEVILRSANKCCICFRTGIVAHHIIFKEEKGPDAFDNLAPLCPNCHDEAHTKSTMTKTLTKELIREFRDKWYNTVDEHRKQLNEINPHFEDKNTALISYLKGFYVLASSKRCLPSTSIKLVFSQYLPHLSESNKYPRSIEIFDYLRDGLSYGEIEAIIWIIKGIYSESLKKDPELSKEFDKICGAFGVVID